ncbi:hypothetical protein TRVL_08778 [Trypanosoma vivax]|nr:hypothetical protein TRVL_08778 [Trypanosoma vivax]
MARTPATKLSAIPPSHCPRVSPVSLSLPAPPTPSRALTLQSPFSATAHGAARACLVAAPCSFSLLPSASSEHSTPLRETLTWPRSLAENKTSPFFLAPLPAKLFISVHFFFSPFAHGYCVAPNSVAFGAGPSSPPLRQPFSPRVSASHCVPLHSSPVPAALKHGSAFLQLPPVMFLSPFVRKSFTNLDQLNLRGCFRAAAKQKISALQLPGLRSTFRFSAASSRDKARTNSACVRELSLACRSLRHRCASRARRETVR